MHSTWVTDDVWAELDPSATRLPRRTRRRLAALVAVLVLLLLAFVAARVSGLTHPQLWASEVHGETVHPQTRTFSIDVQVDNTGWFDERITAIGSHGPGVRLLRSSTRSATVPHSGHILVRLSYAVTDCRARLPHDVPVIVHLHRPWGSERTVLEVPPISPFPESTLRVSEFRNGPASVTCGQTS